MIPSIALQVPREYSLSDSILCRELPDATYTQNSFWFLGTSLSKVSNN